MEAGLAENGSPGSPPDSGEQLVAARPSSPSPPKQDGTGPARDPTRPPDPGAPDLRQGREAGPSPGTLWEPQRRGRCLIYNWQEEFQKKSEDELYQAPEPPEYRSVTHRDYQQAGTLLRSPTPSQPHYYQLEEPETYWFQRAKDIRGVGTIQGLKPSFRRNSSFTTPVPLALSHHLP
ncbi:sperm-associated antigen 8 isoform X2 [Ornithorhynchus anatinus]|uniref:sperm-associated antigen 8 isoform X2 n=1 Tax=Ornithorhynchus anatinus TaxID=9258 RepID=UPI0010A8C09D|nr:sperm-associated antigen 8 isoform X2 [Ornithorhynchus anatinus]